MPDGIFKEFGCDIFLLQEVGKSYFGNKIWGMWQAVANAAQLCGTGTSTI